MVLESPLYHPHTQIHDASNERYRPGDDATFREASNERCRHGNDDTFHP